MKCPYCNEFRGNNKVRGYPIREQLKRHIQVRHKVETKATELLIRLKSLESK